jgi:hypothetical protein
MVSGPVNGWPDCFVALTPSFAIAEKAAYISAM